MTRRAILLAACAAVRMRADAADEAWSVISSIASALVEGNLSDFMGSFDPAMPGYDELSANVNGLLGEFVPESSIDPLKNDGDDRSRTLELDWRLTLVDQQNDAASTNREQTVVCRLAKQGRKWRITALQPVSFFAPPARAGR
jgi:hypothetical protein